LILFLSRRLVNARRAVAIHAMQTGIQQINMNICRIQNEFFVIWRIFLAARRLNRKNSAPIYEIAFATLVQRFQRHLIREIPAVHFCNCSAPRLRAFPAAAA
jgi:hypothetical protein